MKFLKKIPQLLCVFYLLLCSSCVKNKSVKHDDGVKTDSISIFLQEMKNDTLAFETRLQSADKALQWVNSTKDSSATKDILAHKIYFFGNLMQFDSAINTSKELLQLSMSENDSAAIGNNYFRLAYYYNQNFKKDSAFLCYKLSKEIHLQLGDSSKAGENLAEMAIIQSDLGDFVGSDDTGIQALKYLDENNFQYLTAVYNCIAISAIGQKNYNEAIYWYDKAINISIKNTDKISYLQNKANAYRYLKIYDKSITILDSLSKVDLNNHKSRATIIDNLAYTKWLAKKEENVLPELERAL